MSKHDDFDLIEDNEDDSAGMRPVYWLIGIVLLVGFGFAVGLAYMTLSNRLGADLPDVVPTYTATNALVIGGATATPPGTSSGTPSAAPEGATSSPAAAAPTVTPLASATAAATSTAVPTVACLNPVDPAFGALTPELGCATTQSGRIVWAAWEPFERGAMLWRSDTDRAYSFNNDGNWSVIDTSWDGQAIPSRGAPPAGLTAPERGFGYAWATDDALFFSLGWARDGEKGFCARVQDFENGFALQSEAVASCTPDNLFNHAAAGGWTPIILEAGNNGRWIGSNGVTQSSNTSAVAPAVTPPAVAATLTPLPGPTSAPPSPAPASGQPSTVEQATRPREQGRFFAPRANAITLDGSFNDWPSDWIPLQTVVYNVGDYSGGDDLSARAQFAWNADGLYIALRVRDERFRPGPPGSNLWQGDSIEINLDRLLAQDFDDSQANDDDYQVGLSFAEGSGALLGYRWLPLAQEGAFTPEGAMQPQMENGEWQGYNLETRLAWPLVGIDGAALPEQAALGFVLAVNDNDSATPSQETILATSPARTEHDNPTQWGTLILLP